MTRHDIILASYDAYIATGITASYDEAISMYLSLHPDLASTFDRLIPGPVPFEARKILDQNRPLCSYCDRPLKYKAHQRDRSGRMWEGAWVCICGSMEYTDKTYLEWLAILKNENKK